MESLVNYSSEDEQDDYSYTKVAVRERGGSGGTSSTSGPVKRTNERSKSHSFERDASPYRKGREAGNERFKSGNTNNHTDEDKYKRSEKSRDHKEKRGNRESRNNRDNRDDTRGYDNGHKYDYKKHDDHKRYREPKRDHKRDNNEYYRDDKKYNRYDDRKSAYEPNYKDRFYTSKSRYNDRKQYDDRSNDERRGTEDRRNGGGTNFADRRREFNDRRNYDDRKCDRRNNDDRRTQRSYNDDRSSTYRSRRSNSPPPQRNSSNKYSERKDDNNTRRERKHHTRSKTRSRSHSVEKSTDCSSESYNNAQRTATGEFHTETHPDSESQVFSGKKTLPSARNFEALLTLPLSENSTKQHTVIPVTTAIAVAGSNSTTSTVQLPSYYNPNVINPNKYVEQMQKRKLIWGAKKSEDSASKWGHAQFSQDQDGKVASKFMRLMGIKSTTGGESSTSLNESIMKTPSSTTPPSSTDVKSREAMFSSMEQQYEVARQVTHTMRGVGLGFGSQSRPY